METITPADDFEIAARSPRPQAWCRLATPEELDRFNRHGLLGSDFAKLMAAYSIRPVVFSRTFDGELGVLRAPFWLLGEIPAADDLAALKFLDGRDQLDVVHLSARQSLKFESALRWHRKRPEKLKDWLEL